MASTVIAARLASSPMRKLWLVPSWNFCPTTKFYNLERSPESSAKLTKKKEWSRTGGGGQKLRRRKSLALAGIALAPDRAACRQFQPPRSWLRKIAKKARSL